MNAAVGLIRHEKQRAAIRLALHRHANAPTQLPAGIIASCDVDCSGSSGSRNAHASSGAYPGGTTRLVSSIDSCTHTCNNIYMYMYTNSHSWTRQPTSTAASASAGAYSDRVHLTL